MSAFGPFQFNPYAIPPAVIALAMLGIVFWILGRERGSPASRAFALIGFAITIWQATKTLMYLSPTAELAFVWAKLGYLGVTFIGPGMYYLSVHLLGVSARRRVVSLVGWAIGVAFCVVILATDWLVTGVQAHFWGFYPRWGWLGFLFLPYFGTMLLLAVREFFLQYRQASPGIYRDRIRALMLAFLIAFAGAIDYLAAYGLEVYPVGYLAVFAFLVIVAQAMARYQLVDLTPSFAATQILATMGDPLIVLDSDWTIRIVNPAVLEVFGFERSELIERPVTLLAAGHEDAVLRLTRLATTPGVRDEETTLYTRAGDPVEVSLSTSRLVDTTAGTVGTVLIARDIRERKQADRALRDNEARFRSLIQNISDVIVVLDADMRVTFVSASSERVLGYTPEEQIGTNALELVHPDDLADAREHWAKLDEPGATVRAEVRVRHKDGSWRVVEATGTNLLDDPTVRGIISVYQDITGRKEAEIALREREEQLRHSQRMEAVGRLAGGVAHDFNNLLTVINGEMILLLEAPGQDPAVRTALEQVLRAGNRASDLTRQLLAFSRRLVLQPKLLDLNVVLADLEKMLRRLIGEDVTLSVALEPNLDKVKADPGQIEQVILNLVVNARDAMPRGGVLSIETRNVSPDDPGAGGRVDRDMVAILVRDTGMGMDEETVQRIFEPFFTTKEQGKGTGLGLATVYGIVEQSGGSIEVTSRVGEGTTFRVLLPRAEGEAATHTPASTDPRAIPGTETILLVEDEDSVRALSETILSRCGYTVHAARNGAHALRICDELAQPIDLLVTDVVMPGMGGREVAERVLEKFPNARVVYMSGYTDDAVLRHGVEAGAVFLPKPFTPAGLAQIVRQALDSPDGRDADRLEPSVA